MLKVKKMCRDALLPVKKPRDAGYDLYGCEQVTIYPGERAMIGTGLICEFPSNYVGRICDRSGVAWKSGLHVLAGVIDSSFRGEWKIILYNTGVKVILVKAQTRIAQILFYKVADFPVIEVNELTETDRSDGGFGSTGER